MKRSEVTTAQQEIRAQLQEAGLTLKPELSIEVADFGLGRYAQEGLGLVVRINTPEYCSKWLTLRPGQHCPRHFHKLKKETFFVLRGQVWLEANGQTFSLAPGEDFTLNPGVWHAFSSEIGAVIEEVSTHDENSDSYFDDPAIVRDPVIEAD